MVDFAEEEAMAVAILGSFGFSPHAWPLWGELGT